MKTKTIDDSTVAYQTNCWYCDHGQIIVARKVGDCIQCQDISRGIPFMVDGDELDVDKIQAAYLNSNYTGDYDFMLSRELAELGRNLIGDPALTPRS